MRATLQGASTDRYLKSVSENTVTPTGFRQYHRFVTDRTSKARRLAAEAVELYRDGLTEQARALWAQAIQLISTVH